MQAKPGRHRLRRKRPRCAAWRATAPAPLPWRTVRPIRSRICSRANI